MCISHFENACITIFYCTKYLQNTSYINLKEFDVIYEL